MTEDKTRIIAGMEIQEDVLELRIENKRLQVENDSLQESYANSEMNLQHITNLLEQAEEIIMNLRDIIASDITIIDTEEKGLFFKQAVEFLKEEI